MGDSNDQPARALVKTSNIRLFIRIAFIALPGLLINLPASNQALSGNIHVDQFGYRTGAHKIAVISDPVEGWNSSESFTPADVYEVRRRGDDETVFTKSIEVWGHGNVHSQSGDRVWWFDFSGFDTPGTYYVYDPYNNRRSAYFEIGSEVYNIALKHALRTFYYQRCSTSKKEEFAGWRWKDESACHVYEGQDLKCLPVWDKNNQSLALDLSGGWHDAGDYNKYVNFTRSVMHELLSAYRDNPDVFFDNNNIPESGNGLPDIIDEIVWELDWLKKMQLEDGTVLMKVSVDAHQSGSPPSSDKAARYYAPAAASAARVLSGIFAHAYYVLGEYEELKDYSEDLLERALLSWEWLENNPGISTYNNSGFQSANPEMDEYNQLAVQAASAVYLFAATGDVKFRDYFNNFYKSFNFYRWGYWYPFEAGYQDAALLYTSLPNATDSVLTDIRENCISSIRDHAENLGAVRSSTDAYRAFLKDNDYVWGSNSVKARKGMMFYNMIIYNLDPDNHGLYLQAARDYLHYLHGVNPLGMVYLTNMNRYGAERSANEMYHLWFGDNTIWDNALSSSHGPAPGFLTGGPNTHFQPAAQYSGPRLSPPLEQPPQKAYRDWNTSWPENSWEITEPAIYYQSAYIRLLANFAGTDPLVHSFNIGSPPGVNIYPNPAKDKVFIEFAGNADNCRITLIDITGRTIMSKNAPGEASGKITIDISAIPPGIYILKTISGRETHSARVIIGN
jgi:endoglucanase